MGILKYKKFIIDLFNNSFAFAIYILAQQMILFPFLSRILNDSVYANFILYISIFNIIVNCTGNELGIVRQVRDSDYEKDKILGDFSRIMAITNIFVIVISIIIFVILKYNILDMVFLIIIMLLANIRLYSAGYYRLKKEFKNVLFQNILYLIGIVIGIIVIRFIKIMWLPLLTAELGVLFHTLKKSDLIKKDFKKSSEYINTLKKYKSFSIISFWNNAVSYCDKFIVYHLFGEYIVAVYFSVTVLSKMVSLLINPLNGVILSWLSNSKDKTGIKNIDYSVKLSFPLVIIVFLLSIPITYLCMKLLYPRYLIDGMKIIIPVCLSIGFGVSASIIKNTIIKYSNSFKLMISYITHFIIFVILGYLMGKNYGLVGFVFSIVISKFQLWLFFLYILIKQRNNLKKEVPNG